eukprot:1448342-Prymnesium_polylepis.1
MLPGKYPREPTRDGVSTVTMTSAREKRRQCERGMPRLALTMASMSSSASTASKVISAELLMCRVCLLAACASPGRSVTLT